MREEFIAAVPRPLGEVCRHNAETTPEAIAITEGDRETSWSTLFRNASQVAWGLLRAGIREGSHVAVLGRTSTEMFEILHGVALAGGIFTPVNWRLSPAEIEFILRDSEAEVLFVTDEMAACARQICPRLSMLRQVVVVGEASGQIETCYVAWRNASSNVPATRAIGADEIVVQLYTSGTTGHPKGALLTQQYFIAAGEMRRDESEEIFAMKKGEEFLHYFPIFHIGGIGTHYHPAIRGCGIVLLPEFRPNEVLRLIETKRIPVLMGVPTMLQALLDHPEISHTDFSRVRYCTYGAAPMPIVLRDRLMSIVGCRFSQTYGMTEAAYVSSLSPTDHEGLATKSASVGRAMPRVEIKIVDLEGRELPRGTPGEVVIRSPLMAAGYWNLSDLSSAAFQGGWYWTGDGGYLDDESYLFLTDRIKDVVISGGENIYPAEIENVLYRHPAVSRAAVVGVPDLKWGEVPKAFIVPKSDTDFSAAALHEFLAQHLGHYKLPKYYEVIDALPLNSAGKVLKRELRERSNAGAIKI